MSRLRRFVVDLRQQPLNVSTLLPIYVSFRMCGGERDVFTIHPEHAVVRLHNEYRQLIHRPQRFHEAFGGARRYVSALRFPSTVHRVSLNLEWKCGRNLARE